VEFSTVTHLLMAREDVLHLGSYFNVSFKGTNIVGDATVGEAIQYDSIIKDIARKENTSMLVP
jgi:hypothetical protein